MMDLWACFPFAIANKSQSNITFKSLGILTQIATDIVKLLIMTSFWWSPGVHVNEVSMLHVLLHMY